MKWKKVEVDTDEEAVDFVAPPGESFDQIFDIVDADTSDTKGIPK